MNEEQDYIDTLFEKIQTGLTEMTPKLMHITSNPNYQPSITPEGLLGLVCDEKRCARYDTDKTALAIQSPYGILSSDMELLAVIFPIKIAFYGDQAYEDEFSNQTWHVNDSMVIKIDRNGESSVHESSLVDQGIMNQPNKRGADYYLNWDSLHSLQETNNKTPQIEYFKIVDFDDSFFLKHPTLNKLANSCKTISANKNFKPNTTKKDLENLRSMVFSINHKAATHRLIELIIREPYLTVSPENKIVGVVYPINIVDNGIDDMKVIFVNHNGESSVHKRALVDQGDVTQPMEGEDADKYLNWDKWKPLENQRDRLFSRNMRMRQMRRFRNTKTQNSSPGEKAQETQTFSK